MGTLPVAVRPAITPTTGWFSERPSEDVAREVFAILVRRHHPAHDGVDFVPVDRDPANGMLLIRFIQGVRFIDGIKKVAARRTMLIHNN